MQLFFDFLPIVIFFIVFKFFGIYAATGAAMAISLLQVLFEWFKNHKVSKLQLINLVLIGVLGGSTLLLHNELFIKWKPTVLYWALGLVFLWSQLFSEKPIIQRLLEKNIVLPSNIWRNLSRTWVVFFALMGLLNIIVAYSVDTNTWVNFKLFGILGLTILFTILQAIYLAKHIKENPEKLPPS